MKYSLLKLKKNIFVATLVLGSFFFLVSEAQAQVVVTDGNLTAEFESVPLFGTPEETNIAPSSTSSKSVKITNNGSESESVIVSVTNEYSSGLAEAMTLTITDSNTSYVYFSDTMSNFFLDIPIDLGVLGAGDSRLYNLVTKFLDASGNPYQDTTLGFDIHFGFASGASVTPGGGGGGGSTPGTTNTPEGQVAGTSTSTNSNVPAWWSPFTSWIESTVLGDTSSNVEDIEIEDELIDGEVGNVLGFADSIDENADTETKDDCLLTWLLLLALISLIAGSIDDLWRHKGEVFRGFFVRNIIFLFGFVLTLGVVFVLGWLDNIWYLLAGTWAIMQIVDYFQHTKEWMVWSPISRLLTYCILGLLLVGTTLILDWPCTWWPFAVIAITSLLAFVFGER